MRGCDPDAAIWVSRWYACDLGPDEVPVRPLSISKAVGTQNLRKLGAHPVETRSWRTGIAGRGTRPVSGRRRFAES
ncbi:MAG: hypothetical protein CL908_00480 [Deltaproteobacteria bacterium]|nr:hypothetical protein [Deltaproteobacteria bacterium]